jgi:hypothetical protein
VVSEIDRELAQRGCEARRERLARSIATYLRDDDWASVYATLGVELPLAFLLDVARQGVDAIDQLAFERANRLRDVRTREDTT